MESSSKALDSTGTELSTVALTGRPYHGIDLPKVSIVEGIDYADGNSRTPPQVLANRLKEAAAKALGDSPDVWHIHNHSLGKNPAFSEAVRLLAEEGHGMLLHLHDFAEDGRPANYKALRDCLGDLSGIYPLGPRIRYAALNQRDASFLVVAGLPVEQLVLLPNPIRPPIERKTEFAPTTDSPHNLMLCPVRAVRRKNLGELALLAAAHPDLTFANTLGPTNPAYEPDFQRWKDFVAQLKLPVRYAFAEDTDASFAELVASSRALVTTSVAEGFGLAFLEPWIQGKSLAGRDLPEITADFREAGLDLAHLYDRIELPVELIDEKNLRSQVENTLDTMFATYGKPKPVDGIESALGAMVRNGQVDFGRLHEPLQEILVRKINSSPLLAHEVRRQANLTVRPKELLEANAQVVAREYGLLAYGQKLLSVYLGIAATSGGSSERLDAKAILAAFLKPERLFLLRT
ncbi:MAG: hypothetical protein VCA36_11910 [Opitutales bacterium]